MSLHAKPSATLSGPPVSRWFGFFPEFKTDSLGYLLRCRQYGDVAKLPMGTLAAVLLRERDPAMYLLNNPVDIRHVLVVNQDNYTKAPVPPVEARVFGQGVLHTEGAVHHRQRRIFLPFFHGDHVSSYADLITNTTAGVTASWPEDTTIDVGQSMTYITLSVIWRLLFGRDIGSEAETVTQAITTGQHLIKLQYDSVFARMMPLWIPTRLHRDFADGHARLESIIRRLIRDRRSAPAQSPDVLSLLLAATDTAGEPLSEEEIRDELVTFLLAGHETTANALTWGWFLLSQFETVHRQLVQELDTVLNGRLPTTADVPRLRYTKMIWEETLRLYPPAWLLHTRVSRSDDTMPSGAHLPSGARIFISPWSLHRNPQWFPDANRFDPERFSPEAQAHRPAFSYFPFGGGGRRCLGESFAELEGILVIATVASRVRFRLADGRTIRPDPLMTLRPHVPMRMRVSRIDTHSRHSENA
jgi:cytochrome P450